MRNRLAPVIGLGIVVWAAALPAMAATDGASCSTVVHLAPLATAPGVSDLPLPVLLTSDTPVRGLEFELTLPDDFILRDCVASIPGYTCTMRNTEDGVRFVIVAFQAEPIPAGVGKPVAELIVDVIPEILDREVTLTPLGPQTLADTCETCDATSVSGEVQIVAGCEYFFEDMETDAPGWTSSTRSENGAATLEKIADPVGPDTWHLDTASCVGQAFDSTMYLSNGNRGPACLQDSSRDFSQLLSPSIGLPFSGALTLEFDALSYDEAGECSGGGQFDRHDVGITTDGGLTYTILNDCTALADGQGTPLHHVFDITAFAGMTVQLIFVYDTGDASSGHTFAVDNVRINALDMICGSCEGLTLVDAPPAQARIDIEACGAIVAGEAFHVPAGRTVNLRSGNYIVLKDGFRVEPDATFSAVVDPGIVEVSKAPRRLAGSPLRTDTAQQRQENPP